jgi:hypothetical protein
MLAVESGVGMATGKTATLTFLDRPRSRNYRMSAGIENLVKLINDERDDRMAQELTTHGIRHDNAS